MFEYILNLFDFNNRRAAKREAEYRKNTIRRLVAKYSRGNISLQMGNYITEEDIEFLKNKSKDHNFCK